MHSEIVHPDEEETTHVPGTPVDQSSKPRAGSRRLVIFLGCTP